MLCCAVLSCVVLCCVELSCVVLCCVVLSCVVLCVMLSGVSELWNKNNACSKCLSLTTSRRGCGTSVVSIVHV